MSTPNRRQHSRLTLLNGPMIIAGMAALATQLLRLTPATRRWSPGNGNWSAAPTAPTVPAPEPVRSSAPPANQPPEEVVHSEPVPPQPSLDEDPLPRVTVRHLLHPLSLAWLAPALAALTPWGWQQLAALTTTYSATVAAAAGIIVSSCLAYTRSMGGRYKKTLKLRPMRSLANPTLWVGKGKLPRFTVRLLSVAAALSAGGVVAAGLCVQALTHAPHLLGAFLPAGGIALSALVSVFGLIVASATLDKAREHIKENLHLAKQLYRDPQQAWSRRLHRLALRTGKSSAKKLSSWAGVVSTAAHEALGALLDRASAPLRPAWKAWQGKWEGTKQTQRAHAAGHVHYDPHQSTATEPANLATLDAAVSALFTQPAPTIPAIPTTAQPSHPLPLITAATQWVKRWKDSVERAKTNPSVGHPDTTSTRPGNWKELDTAVDCLFGPLGPKPTREAFSPVSEPAGKISNTRRGGPWTVLGFATNGPTRPSTAPAQAVPGPTSLAS